MCDLFHVSLYFEEDILKQNRKSGSKVKKFLLIKVRSDR